MVRSRKTPIVAPKIQFWYFGCMSEGSAAHPLPQPESEEDIAEQEPAKVILFNDEVHTFDEVIGQLMKATHCTSERAEALAWEVHTRGKAVVFVGELPRCMEVSGILEEIELMTQIEV
jgi:ATP-dependent Clp protease adaptor protein ClpS